MWWVGKYKMRYIREQKDPYTNSPGGYHLASSFIEFRVRADQFKNRTHWFIKAYRADDTTNAILARFDDEEAAHEALEMLIESITDHNADHRLCFWPLEYVSNADKPAKS